MHAASSATAGRSVPPFFIGPSFRKTALPADIQGARIAEDIDA